MQHEFVEAERKILGRKDSDLSARAGYAGGNAGAKNGKVPGEIFSKLILEQIVIILSLKFPA